MEKKIIMDHEAVLMKIQRMAWQVYENNIEATSILIFGIEGSGNIISSILVEELNKICSIKTIFSTINVNKKDPSSVPAKIDISIDEYKDFPLIIVDDVLNSARTIAYAMNPFLEAGFKKIQTAVLVNRNHRSYPIAADFSGISLATTLQEHVNVMYVDGKFSVTIE